MFLIFIVKAQWVFYSVFHFSSFCFSSYWTTARSALSAPKLPRLHQSSRILIQDILPTHQFTGIINPYKALVLALTQAKPQHCRAEQSISFSGVGVVGNKNKNDEMKKAQSEDDGAAATTNITDNVELEYVFICRNTKVIFRLRMCCILWFLSIAPSLHCENASKKLNMMKMRTTWKWGRLAGSPAHSLNGEMGRRRWLQRVPSCASGKIKAIVQNREGPQIRVLSWREIQYSKFEQWISLSH